MPDLVHSTPLLSLKTCASGPWQDRLEKAKFAAAEGPAAAAEGGDGAIGIVKHSHLSLVDASHHGCVTDLVWLPGVTISRDGKATRVSSC